MLGLVLGGGAAKGYAHIGVLKLLEEEGIKPGIVVGASMGALIGAFYAAGFSPKEIEEITLTIDRRKKHWLFNISPTRQGLVDGRNILKFLTPYLGEKKIEDLPLKYGAVTTDIKNGSEIVITTGNLLQAVRAAIAIPVILTPHLHLERTLIDGGFISPVPVTAAQSLGAKKIIAVNVLHKEDFPRRVSETSATDRNFTIKQIFKKTIALIFSRLIDYQVEKMKAGVLINIDTSDIGLSQFEKAKLAIEIGYESARNKRDELRRLLKNENLNGQRARRKGYGR
ncbi:MAG: patatin-like phospholipase family protein [candidate division WOR-3 bacterium]